MLIERRENEDMTAFTMRRVRSDILEQAEKEARAQGSAGSYSYRKACHDVADRIRKMAEE